MQLGGICLERGDLEGCPHYNEEAANCRAKFPFPLEQHCLRASAARRDKAIAALRKALKWDPKFIQAKNALATAYYMKGDFKASVEACRELLAQEPGFAPAWNNLALALFDLKDYEQAVEAADKARELGFEVSEGFLEELKPHRKRTGSGRIP